MHVAENMGDHAFAAWLRQRGALNNYRVQPTHNEWYDKTGEVIAIVVYNNANSTRVIILNEA